MDKIDILVFCPPIPSTHKASTRPCAQTGHSHLLDTPQTHTRIPAFPTTTISSPTSNITHLLTKNYKPTYVPACTELSSRLKGHLYACKGGSGDGYKYYVVKMKHWDERGVVEHVLVIGRNVRRIVVRLMIAREEGMRGNLESEREWIGKARQDESGVGITVLGKEELEWEMVDDVNGEEDGEWEIV